MHPLVARLERYVRETLGLSVAPVPWEGERRLPFFLQERYRFFAAQVLDQRCLFMVARVEEEESPAAIRQHVEQIEGRHDAQVVYVRERVTAYNRRRLIEQRVPFVVPGNQMYLPMLGVDLREHYRKLRSVRSTFAPSTQAVFIHALRTGAGALSSRELTPRLGYSAMTMSRVFDELETAELGVSLSSGRERCLQLEAPTRDLWTRAQTFLRDPVRRRHTIRMPERCKAPGPLAGLSALAHYSRLAEPVSVAVALSRESWKSLQEQEELRRASIDEPDALCVEEWIYPPTLFAEDDVVDRLSLFLSLRRFQDERIEQALDRLMDGVAW